AVSLSPHPQPPLPQRGEGEKEGFWLPLSPLWERGLGGEGRWTSLVGHGLDEDLHRRVAAERQPATADLQQAGGAVAEHLQASADADAQLGHAGHPGGIAGHVGHFPPFTGPQAFEGQQGEGVQGPCSRRAWGGGLLRQSLNTITVAERVSVSRGRVKIVWASRWWGLPARLWHRRAGSPHHGTEAHCRLIGGP